MKKWITDLDEIDGPGQYYHKGGHGAPFTIDTEIPDHGDDDVYVICIEGRWLSDTRDRLKTFRTIAGCRKCLNALATRGAGNMGYWLSSSVGSGGKIKGSGYRFRPKRK